MNKETKDLNRRQFLAMAAGGAAVTLSLFNGCQTAPISTAQPQQQKPNIVFLLTDDQRWDAMSCAGNSVLQTPNMDRLAADGTMFKNAFITSPVCMASRASIFTGLYEQKHGCNFNTGNLSPALFAKSYPVLLRQAGYQTGFIGKFGFAVSDVKEEHNKYSFTWHNEDNLPFEQFDVWYGFAGQGRHFPNGKSGKHLTDIMTEQAVEFLENRSGDKPFCLSVSFKAPHLPFMPAPRYSELYKDAVIPVPLTAGPEYLERLPETVKNGWGHIGYWQMYYSTPQAYQETVKQTYRLMAGLDESVGKIRRELKRLGLDKNTVIVLLSDNGDMQLEHQLGGKALMYEESIRVPLIIYDPRAPKSVAGQKRDELALNIDIAPTLLSIAGVEVPDCMQGKNLAPIVAGAKIPWRQDIFCENQFRLGEWGDAPDWGHQYYPMSQAVRTEQYKYIVYTESQPPYEELFDLSVDPHETTNLATDERYQQVLNSLRQRHKQLLKEAKGI